jgi:hypothetical protein
MRLKYIAVSVAMLLLTAAAPIDDDWEIGASAEGLATLSVIEKDVAWSQYGITSLHQGMKVESILVNRGNCEVDDAMTTDGNQYQFPFSLNYGDVLTIHMMCQPIEIIVHTNIGWQLFPKH